jgi:hypothetical protein
MLNRLGDLRSFTMTHLLVIKPNAASMFFGQVHAPYLVWKCAPQTIGILQTASHEDLWPKNPDRQVISTRCEMLLYKVALGFNHWRSFAPSIRCKRHTAKLP